MCKTSESSYCLNQRNLGKTCAPRGAQRQDGLGTILQPNHRCWVGETLRVTAHRARPLWSAVVVCLTFHRGHGREAGIS